jgi:hypothetical protein
LSVKSKGHQEDYFFTPVVSVFFVVSFLAASIESCLCIILEAFINESIWALADKESAIFCWAALSPEPVHAPNKRQGMTNKISLVFISKVVLYRKITNNKRVKNNS